MTDHKKLIFRLSGIGFFIDLDHIVEVVDRISAQLDPSRSDMARGIVSAFNFRQTWIPAVDPTLKLGLISAVGLNDKISIVLNGKEGNWAVLVDQVEDLSPAEIMLPCAIPFLLQISAVDCYSQLMLYKKEPYVGFEPERFYGVAN